MSCTSSAAEAAIVGDPTRLHRLDELLLLDTGPERALDRLTGLAARMTGAPIALLSVIDDERQYFKSAHGLAEPWAARGETPLSHSFCVRVMVEDRPLVVDDARRDPEIEDHPAVEELGVDAYLGVPLVTHDGVRLGALCCIDDTPHAWSDEDLVNLEDLAAAVVNEIHSRELRADLVSSLEHVRHAEAASRRYRQLTAAVLDTLDQEVCVVDDHATIIETNRWWDAAVDDELIQPFGRRLLDPIDGDAPIRRVLTGELSRAVVGGPTDEDRHDRARPVTIEGVVVGGRRFGVVSRARAGTDHLLTRS